MGVRSKYNLGDTYGYLTITGAGEDYIVPTSGRRNTRVMVRCLCGSEYLTRLDNLNRSKKSGRICHCPKCSGNFIRKYSTYFTGTFFGRIKKGARDRKLEFALTPQDIDSLFEQQNFKCAYCGIKLKTESLETRPPGRPPLTNDPQKPSLDRIDSNKGYIIGNVQFVCSQCNYMKLDYSHKEFLDKCIQIVEYTKDV